MNDIAIPVLHSAVAIMTPLLLAAMGGLFTELSGMLNIALEGLCLPAHLHRSFLPSIPGTWSLVF
jgi:ABC-type uncharacterized transport system permease subunit